MYIQQATNAYLTSLKLEKLRRLKYEVYRRNPLKWLEEVMQEDTNNYVWSAYGDQYDTHKWDGDKDPLYHAWMDIADNEFSDGNPKKWVGIKAGTGCHAKGTLIRMWDGSAKAVEDVLVGDKLMGDDSTSRTVLSLARGRDKMYRVVPVKGKPWEVNEGHILSLKRTGTKSRPHWPLYINVPVHEYLTWSNNKKHHYKLYRKSIQQFGIRNKKLPYDPYLIGLWIGDGSRHSFQITNIDSEIISYLRGWAEDNNYQFSVYDSKGTRTPVHCIHKGHASGKLKTNKLLLYVKKECWKDEAKRIPKEYLTASVEDRLRLLAGLVDSDGSHHNGYIISTKYPDLAEDIAFLARGLGMAAYIKDRMSICPGMTEARLYKAVGISGDVHRVPSLLSRKQGRKRTQIKDVLNTGFSLMPLEEDNYYGFELTGNHLYMLHDCTVTHNTSKTHFLARLVLWYLDVYEDSMVITTAPREGQLTQNVWSEIGKVIDKFKAVRPYTRLTKLSLKPEGNNPYDTVTTQHSHLAFGFVVGTGSEEQSATKAQGFHRERMLIICEETPGMKAAVMTALQNTSTGEYNTMVAVGNPDGELDELAKFMELGRVKNYQISAYDYPNVVLKKSVIPGAVTQSSIDFRAEKYGRDSPLYLSRVRGITPAEGDDNVVKKAWVEACMVGSIRWDADKARPTEHGFQAVGVDVSNSESGDKAATAYGFANTLYDVREFQCPNANAIADNMLFSDAEIEARNEGLSTEKRMPVYGLPKMADIGLYSQFIGVDAVGVGVGTINCFIGHGHTVQGLHGGQWDEVIPCEELVSAEGSVVYKPLYKFANLRSQMIWELREDLRNERVVFNIQDTALKAQIIKELCAAKFVLQGGAIAIEKKEIVKKRLGGKSPNVADAITYWNWVRKGYRANLHIDLPVSGGS